MQWSAIGIYRNVINIDNTRFFLAVRRLHFPKSFCCFFLLRLDEAYVASDNAVPDSNMPGNLPIDHATAVSKFNTLCSSNITQLVSAKALMGNVQPR